MADWLTNWGKDVMWKRRQRIGKGRHWPKHFIISDYSIEVKWLTDQYWPKHLCKSSWYLEKEANLTYETYETYEIYETNEKEANWKSREELTQTNYASHPGTWKRRQTESQGRSWPKPMMQVILVCGKGGKLKVNVMKCRGPNGPF